MKKLVTTKNVRPLSSVTLRLPQLPVSPRTVWKSDDSCTFSMSSRDNEEAMNGFTVLIFDLIVNIDFIITAGDIDNVTNR